ncbi:MAG: hypothetical protein NTW99_10515, partial [Chloroflexi bacterium]|nr:hypothetical protein [Chloroflexota bacterium]
KAQSLKTPFSITHSPFTALTNKKAVLSADSPLGWQAGSYAPGAAVRARQGIAIGILLDREKEGVFIGLSLLCTAPSCKL